MVKLGWQRERTDRMLPNALMRSKGLHVNNLFCCTHEPSAALPTFQ